MLNDGMMVSRPEWCTTNAFMNIKRKDDYDKAQTRMGGKVS